MERTRERKTTSEGEKTQANSGSEPACRQGFIRIKSYLVLSVYLSVTQFGCDFNILFYVSFFFGNFCDCGHLRHLVIAWSLKTKLEIEYLT